MGVNGKGSGSMPAKGGVNDQESSRLFKLPLELRQSIYKSAFQSTRISHGERPVQRLERLNIRPIPNSLAVLRTCRRVRNEIGDSWLSQVRFSFEDPTTMMDKLAALPIARLAKVRHVRVRGETQMLSFGDDDAYYRLVHLLPLLPGLQLDTLTVLNMYSNSVTYDTLNTLIMYSNGWKELRFISHSSAFLGYAYPRDESVRYQRRPQPSHWAGIMNDRDGIESKPSVTVYRSTLPGQVCSVTNEATRVVFEQPPPDDNDPAVFGGREDPLLMAGSEKKKELMVIVRRGKHVGYQQKENAPHLGDLGDIRTECPNMTWSEIKARHIDLLEDEDEDFYWSDDDLGNDAETVPKIVDSYQDVDEYGWTRLNWDPNA